MYKNITIEPENVYTVHFFAEMDDLNYQQAVNTLDDIDYDLRQVNSKHRNLVQRNGKVNTIELDVDIDQYRYYLLKNSVPFQILLTCINGYNLTIDEFCQKHDVSRSTVSRHLLALSKFLKKFKLRLTYSPIGLVGNEGVIRLILFYIFWIGVRNIDWPFSVDRTKVDSIITDLSDSFPLNHNDVGHAELEFMIAIAISRIENGVNFSSKIEWDELFKTNELEKFSLALQKVVAIDKKFQESEAFFLKLLGNFAPNYTPNQTKEISVAVHTFYLKNPQHPISKFNYEFVNHVEQDQIKKAFTKTEREFIFANIANITLGYYVLNSPYPDFEIFGNPLYPANEVYKNLEQNNKFFIDKLVRESDFSRFRSSKDYLTRRFTNLIYPMINDYNEQHQLLVGFAMEQNQSIIMRLKSFLSSLNFVRVEPFNPDHLKNYDTIISSSTIIKKQFPNAKFFYWDLTYGQSELLLLYSYLQNIYLDKQR